jgi:septal ring-binding cell division protein DamX
MRSRDGIDQSGKFEISATGVMLLAIATMVASGIVFLLGIYVGKGMVEQRLAQESRVVRLPVPTPSAGGGGKGDEVDVTFWDKLGKGEATPPPAAAPSPTVAETPLRVSPLGATPAPPQTEHKVEAPPAPAPTRPPPAVVEGGSFQIQVNAMADKARADELVHDLKSLGYAPFISPARVGDKTLYRVRVGNLPSAEAAKQAVTRLREQGYPNAFLAAEVNDR